MVQEAEECEGGPRTAIPLPANWPLRMPKSIKEVRLLDKVVFVEIVDTGVDEYTFDNTWEDGTPKVLPVVKFLLIKGPSSCSAA